MVAPLTGVTTRFCLVASLTRNHENHFPSAPSQQLFYVLSTIRFDQILKILLISRFFFESVLELFGHLYIPQSVLQQVRLASSVTLLFTQKTRYLYDGGRTGGLFMEIRCNWVSLSALSASWKQRAIITYVNFIMVHYADSGSFVMGNRGVLAKESTDNKSVEGHEWPKLVQNETFIFGGRVKLAILEGNQLWEGGQTTVQLAVDSLRWLSPQRSCVTTIRSKIYSSLRKLRLRVELELRVKQRLVKEQRCSLPQ
ncbi:hypothetical protein ACFE04_025386 [Oxalis oulophora]